RRSPTTAGRQRTEQRTAIGSKLIDPSWGETLEAPFQAKLHGARAVCVDGMEERSSRHAVSATGSLKSGSVIRSRIAAHDIVSAWTGIVGVVHPKLSRVEQIENFGAELKPRGLTRLEVLEQGQVEVEASRIIQEVAACISEGQAAWGDEFRGIPEK